MTNPSIRKVLQYAIAKKLPIKKFKLLYEELEAKSDITKEDYIRYFLSIDSEKPSYYKEYQINLVINVSISNEDSLEGFWTNILDLNEDCQLVYLIRWNSFICSSAGLSKNLLNILINNHLVKYTNQVVGDSNPSNSFSESRLAILNYMVFFWGSIIDNFQDCLEIDPFKKSCSLLIGKLNESENSNSINYLISKTKKIFTSNDFEVGVSIAPNDSTLAAPGFSQKNFLTSNVNSRKYGDLFGLKKCIWIHDNIKNWKFQDKLLLDKFVKIFFPQNNILSNNIVSSFLVSLLNGFASSIMSNDPQYVLFNYKNFLLSKFSQVVLESKFSSNFESSIIRAFELLDESLLRVISNVTIGERNFDIRKLFIKNCICNELIPIQSYFTFFPTENINQQGLIHELNQYKLTIDIEYQFREKLLNVNSEFTSLEESGLIEFMDSLPQMMEFSRKSQEQLSSIVVSTISDLISDNQNEKLSRLILAILHNPAVLYYISYNVESGPHLILNKLMQYLDSESFDGDDADNLQDLYSYFGIILLGILSLIEIYNIDYSKFLIKFSYSVDYINNFYYRLCDNFTNSYPKEVNDDERTIIANYNDLLNDWINALFDDNNDGLSDDLIKSVNVKQAYKMISIIYQQAIIATNSHKIDKKILGNGIDYLTQPLLAPCMMSLVSWLLEKIDVVEADLESIYVKVLCELINSNLDNDKSQDLNNESILIFKIILNSKGKSIIKALKRNPNWTNSSSIQEVIEKISKKIDSNQIVHDDSAIVSQSVLSLNDQIKQSILKMVKENRCSYQHICKLIDVNRSSFLEFLFQEIISYHKSNNEDIKVFIDIAVYVTIIQSVNSVEEKNYWINELSSDFTSNEKHAFPEDNSFFLSMESHFSSIFNFNTSQRNGDDSDDLFNDGSESLLNSSFQSLTMKAKRYDNLIHDMLRLKQHMHQNSDVIRAYYTLKDKIAHDLQSILV